MHRSVPAWLVLILALAAMGSGFAIAQAPAQQPPQTQATPREPRVLSGPDVGFRVEGIDPWTGNPSGTWVVRIDGEWVAAVAAIRTRRLSE